MPLIYALVSRGIHVLAEHTQSGLTGNFSTVSRVLIKKIDTSSDSKCSYVYDQYVFHYMVSQGLIYLCMADTQYSRPAAFSYLNEIHDRFTNLYGDRAKTAIAFAFNADFARVLQSQMEKYNANETNPGRAHDEKMHKIKHQLNEVKDAMMTNIDNVLQRGEKIELLVDKTEVLEQHAFKFQRGAKTLRRQMCIKNAKWTVAIVVVLVLIIYIILAIACGGADLPKCK